MIIESSMSDDTSDASRGKTIAVVSGKGGSGKTMVAVALAQGISMAGQTAVLFDADFATGGLTYYLTFREFATPRVGLSDLLSDRSQNFPLSEWVAQSPIDIAGRSWLSGIRLVSIGDQRRLTDYLDENSVDRLKHLISQASSLASLVVVDCRGGIDNQSLAVCGMVDEILIVVETDTTSIRSSQHLVDALSQHSLRNKISGFVLNKVMDDPTSHAKTASSILGITYLGPIPFDIEATRSYIQGMIPLNSTLFCRHVFSAIPKILGRTYQGIAGPILSPSEFGTVTLRSPEIRYGGIAIFALSFYVTLIFWWLISGRLLSEITIWIFILTFNILVLAALSDPIKQFLGRMFRQYTSLYSRILRRSPR